MIVLIVIQLKSNNIRIQINIIVEVKTFKRNFNESVKFLRIITKVIMSTYDIMIHEVFIIEINTNN